MERDFRISSEVIMSDLEFIQRLREREERLRDQKLKYRGVTYTHKWVGNDLRGSLSLPLTIG